MINIDMVGYIIVARKTNMVFNGKINPYMGDISSRIR